MKNISKMDLLVGLYMFCIAVSELMGAKTFPLIQSGWLNVNASVAIFTIPLVFTINDMVTEVYGRERTRSIIRSGLVVVAMIFLFSLLAVSLPPSARFEPTEGAYDTVFGFSARMSFASLLAFAVAEFTDLFVFVKIRQALGGGSLWLRNNASNFAAQFLDTVIFMFAAFYAFDKGFGENFSFIVGLLIPYWLLKCAMSVIETPFVYAGVAWLKRDE
ncbi:MAG: queuosine precursor transporter [Patescibacteria group bacterium]